MNAEVSHIRGRTRAIRWVRRLLVYGDKSGKLPLLLSRIHRHLPAGPASKLKRLVLRLYCIDRVFDSHWYLSRYPEVARAGIDPAFHYLAIGWREQRIPSPYMPAGNQRLPPDIMLNPVSYAAFFPAQAKPAASQVHDAGYAEPISVATAQPVAIGLSEPPSAGTVVATSIAVAQPNSPPRFDRLQLFILDPPSADGFACARWASQSLDPDMPSFYAYLTEGGGRLSIALEVDAQPVYHFAWPAEVITAAMFIRSNGLEGVEVILGASARLDLDLLLDCLAHPFSLILADYSLLESDGALSDPTPEQAWPLRPRRFAARADGIRCANRAMLTRMQAAAPGLQIDFWTVAETAGEATPVARSVLMTPLQVLVWGDLLEAGGRRAVIEGAKVITARKLPITVTVLGEIYPPLSVEEQSDAAIIVTGPYSLPDRDALIDAIAPHLIWLPATAAAPASFALREVLRRGIPVLASNTPVLVEELQGKTQVAFCHPGADGTGWIEQMLHLMTVGWFAPEREAAASHAAQTGRTDRPQVAVQR